MNAFGPMLVTLAGMVIEVKFIALLNAFGPMLSSREFGSNVTEIKLDAL